MALAPLSRGTIDQDLAPFSALVGGDITELIFELAPTKVRSRVAKALDHYTKAEALVGGDEEMGAIRCIAAEEELVVAVFEWLKLNADKMPEHSDFIGKYKNHLVKLAFYPVLAQIRMNFEPMVRAGLQPVGLEDHPGWQISIVRSGKQVKLRFADVDGKELVLTNPLNASLTLGDKPAAEVLDSIYEQFSGNIERQEGMTVRQYVTRRAGFRNTLLYAEDGGFAGMGDSLRQLIDETFSRTVSDLLWCLAILMSDAPSTKDFGIVGQFISVYRRVLAETKLL